MPDDETAGSAAAPAPAPLPASAHPLRLFGVFDAKGRAEALAPRFEAMSRLFEGPSWRVATLGSEGLDGRLTRHHRVAVAIPARAGTSAEGLLRRIGGRLAAGSARLFAPPAPRDGPEADAPATSAEAADLDRLLRAHSAGLFDEVHAGASPLEGDFAAIFASAEPPSLRLARDPIGTRPLHWFDHGGGLVSWASWPHALLALPDAPRMPDPAALDRYLQTMTPAADRPLWPGLRLLRPGARLDVDGGGATETAWWRAAPDPEGFGLGADASVERVRAALDDAVLARYDRAGPAPSMLFSGGLDSSMVGGTLMRDRPQARPTLYALDSDATEEDRRCRAAFVRLWPRASLAEATSEGLDLLDGAQHVWGRLAAPSLDTTLPMYARLLRQAEDAGEQSLLDGLGGDIVVSNITVAALAEGIMTLRPRLALDSYRALRRQGIGRRGILALHALAPLPGLALAARLAPPSAEVRPAPTRRGFDLRAAPRPRRQLDADLEGMTQTSDYFPSEMELWDDPAGPPRVMPRFSPLFDTRLMAAVAATPTSSRVRGGWHRALPRALLEGIAPEDLRWRIGKNPTQPETWARAAQALLDRRDDWRAFREDPLWREVIDVDLADALYSRLEDRRAFTDMRPVAVAFQFGLFARFASAGGPT